MSYTTLVRSSTSPGPGAVWSPVAKLGNVCHSLNTTARIETPSLHHDGAHGLDDVTGLPIASLGRPQDALLPAVRRSRLGVGPGEGQGPPAGIRSEARRVGKEGVRTCRYGWATGPKKNKIKPKES